MNSIAVYDFAKAALRNTYVSSFVVFAAWLAAIMSGSVLVILLGLIAYLRPMLIASLLNQGVKLKKAKKTAKRKTGLLAAFSFSPAPLALAS